MSIPMQAQTMKYASMDFGMSSFDSHVQQSIDREKARVERLPVSWASWGASWGGDAGEMPWGKNGMRKYSLMMCSDAFPGTIF